MEHLPPKQEPIPVNKTNEQTGIKNTMNVSVYTALGSGNGNELTQETTRLQDMKYVNFEGSQNSYHSPKRCLKGGYMISENGQRYGFDKCRMIPGSRENNNRSGGGIVEMKDYNGNIFYVVLVDTPNDRNAVFRIFIDTSSFENISQRELQGIINYHRQFTRNRSYHNFQSQETDQNQFNPSNKIIKPTLENFQASNPRTVSEIGKETPTKTETIIPK